MESSKIYCSSTTRRIVPADKGDKTIVTDYGLEALECKEDDTIILQERDLSLKIRRAD
jgi:hypothetical protein